MTITEAALPTTTPADDNTFRLAVASVIRRIADAEGITETALADRADIAPARFTRCMDGSIPFTVGEVAEVADALGLDPSSIVGDAWAGWAGSPRATTETVITPCPVPWCDEFGHHPFDDQDSPDYDHTRTCRHETGENTNAEIGAEVHQNDQGELLPPVVEIGGPDAGSFELASAREVSEFIAAVQRAASIVFPEPEESRVRHDAELELQAAIAECVSRAGTPGNAACAALIRLRKAYEALATAGSV